MSYKKYNNKKVEVDGIVFDSIKESRRYAELKLLQRANKITDIQLQVTFELLPSLFEPDIIGKRGGIRKGKAIENAVKYIADFVYYDVDKGKRIVEDSKGFRTKEYVIKRKLFKQKYPEYEFIES